MMVVAEFATTVHMSCRYMLGLAAVPAIIQCVGFVFLPESPRYLVMSQRIHDARATLVRIRATPNVDRELNIIKVRTLATLEI